MLKIILCIIVLLLLIGGGILCFDFKKYIKKHENELVEANMKGLIGRISGMMIISLCVGICGIILQLI